MEKTRKITESVIKFTVNGKRDVEFKIYHSLPNIPGLRIEDALDCWLMRTNIYTAESLVRYIRDKGTTELVLTEKQYKEYLR